MSEFKIEKGIPMPTPKTGAKARYPFAQMKVGDSFLCSDPSPLKIRPAACYWGLRHNAKFSVQQVAGGFRVWRTK